VDAIAIAFTADAFSCAPHSCPQLEMKVSRGAPNATLTLWPPEYTEREQSS
jgi:hypothetical protein